MKGFAWVGKISSCKSWGYRPRKKIAKTSNAKKNIVSRRINGPRAARATRRIAVAA